MDAPKITREYCEDLPDDPALEGEWAYRYWEYVFDFGHGRYRARVYTDESDVAYVLELEGPIREEEVALIARRLEDEGVREVQMLGPSGAFEPVARGPN
jgi:hypothetical protein